ncbi:MAG TPA: hypothetical protein VF823_01070 [Anaerolineales bacterium]
MRDLNEIRFLAAGYPSLHGLKLVPLGLLLIGITVWANFQQGPARDFTIPIVTTLGLAILYWRIDRYYARTFGSVRQKPGSLRLLWLLMAAGAVLALAAAWIDARLKWQGALVGLVMAAGLLVDYLRITWTIQGRRLLYYPVLAVLMVLISLLQLLGGAAWWPALGVRPYLGMMIVFGLVILACGILSHLFLVQALPPKLEADHGRGI